MSSVMEDNKSSLCVEWEPGISLHNLNIKCNTCQCMVLIYYNVDEVAFGKFRNTMIAHNPVMRAYGNGEFLGIAKDICCIEGVFPRNQNIGILTFDRTEEAYKCFESKIELREPHHYGGHELYIVPLCNPAQSWPGYRYIQLDIYETKNSILFTKYVNQLINIITCHGGHVIAGSTQTGHFLGLRKALFLFIVQWRNSESFFECNKEVTPLQRQSGSSCSSRILFQLDTQYFNRY